ncbi:MAG: BON domain-containing protein [Blastocatellia bacterium]
MRASVLSALVALILLVGGCHSQAVDDSAVTAKVKGKLAADSETSAIKISVETKEGVVRLTGTVPTALEKTKAEQIARNTDGVARVVNEIAVKPETAGATNLGEKAENTLKAAGEAIGDAAILAKLKAKFVADGITGTDVDVNDGKVILKGQVDDAVKKAKAEEIAKKTDGVKDVRNELVVKKAKSA